jgi:teichuronic acid biosynthesis glycosyltransferase TuaC
MDKKSSAADNPLECEDPLTGRTLLIISPDFPAKDNRYMGSVFVKYQVEALKSRFKKIIVIVPVLFSGGILANDRYCNDYSYDNISVYYPRCFFFPRSLSVPLIKNSHKLFLDTRLFAVQRLIERRHLRFDLIHAHFTWPSGYIAVRLKERYKVPVAVTIHEDSGWLLDEIEMNNENLISSWKDADALIRVNQNEIPLLKQYNPDVYFIPNGFSPRFRPLDKKTCRSQLSVSLEKKVLFCVGDLIERKGFSSLVDAMKIVCRENPDVMCYIGGKGPEEKNLLRQIRDNNLEKNIFLIGFIAEEILQVWMNCADLYILPSIQESFGIVQIEALACGKPVIAARNAGSREIIASEDVGLLCEPADPVSLAHAICRGLDKPWDIQKILDYSKKYSMDMVVKPILSIYSHILRKEKTYEL